MGCVLRVFTHRTLLSTDANRLLNADHVLEVLLVVIPRYSGTRFDFIREYAEIGGRRRVWVEPVMNGEPGEIMPIVAVEVHAILIVDAPDEL